jgi:hypothetical protein
MKEYKIKQKRGIDDLQNIYAWVGNSQGDESHTNIIEVGLASDGWMSYMFKNINFLDQNAINIESARRKQANEDYIKKLKEEGKFGQEYELSLHIKENPLFDRVINLTDKPPLETYKMLFIDTNGE